MSHQANISAGTTQSAPDTSRGQAAPGDGRHPTGGVTDATDAPDSKAHIGSDVPAPGNKDLATGGPTSMSDSSTKPTGQQGGPGGIGSVSSGLAHSDTPIGSDKKQASGSLDDDPAKQQQDQEDGKSKVTPEAASAAGDGTFGDGKFDAAAPGAGHRAQQLTEGAHGHDEAANVPVN